MEERVAVHCTPEWEPTAVTRTTAGLFNWRCLCGVSSLAPYIGEENARRDFVAHVMKRREWLDLP